MATFSYEIPDDQAIRVTEALCIRNGYDEEQTSDTKEDFAKKAVASWLMMVVSQVEEEQAHNAAVAKLEPPPVISIT